MHNEASQLISEIDRVAANSKFNGTALLDGTFQGQGIQVGAGNNASDRITVSINSARASALGVGSASSYKATAITGQGGSAGLVAGGLSINGVSVGAAASNGDSFTEQNASGIAKAAAINAVSGTSGVTATVKATAIAGTAAAGFATEITSGHIKINGVDIGGMVAAGDAKQRGSQVAAAVNAVSSQTGVSAIAGTDGAVALAAADGRNITVQTGASAAAANTGITQDVSVTVTKISAVTLKSNTAAGIVLAGNTAAATASLGLTNTTVAATATTGAGVSALDLNSIKGSQDALATLDSAIVAVTNSRASLGAYQNRLTASISNLETTSMNLSASRSRIMDTDYATETSNLAKSQIIQQAATAMLAQANQSSQTVLALLK